MRKKTLLGFFIILLLGNEVVWAQEGNSIVLAGNRVIDFSNPQPELREFSYHPGMLLPEYASGIASINSRIGVLDLVSSKGLVWDNAARLINPEDTLAKFRYGSVIPIFIPTENRLRHLLVESIQTYESGPSGQKIAEAGLYTSVLLFDTVSGNWAFENGKKRIRLRMNNYFDLAIIKKGIGGFWLVARTTHQFEIWKIDNDKVDFHDAYSSGNSHHNGYIWNQKSILSFSQKGDNLLELMNYDSISSINQFGYSGYFVKLLDFNPQTGTLGSERVLTKELTCDSGHSGTYQLVRGQTAFFSPNGHYIYFVPLTQKGVQIWQLDKNMSNVALENIEPLFQETASSGICVWGGIGPDEKAYLLTPKRLYSIMQPDVPNKESNIILLKESQGSTGLLDQSRFIAVLGNKMHIKHYYRKLDVDYALWYDCATHKYGIENKLADKRVASYTWTFYKNGFVVLDTMVNSSNFGLKLENGDYSLVIKAIDTLGYHVWRSDSIHMFPRKIQVEFGLTESRFCRRTEVLFTIQKPTNQVNDSVGEKFWLLFGDGRDSSLNGYTPIIAHLYDTVGLFQPRLVYSNGYCQDTFVHANKIEIIDAPLAGISLSDTGGCFPFDVSFYFEGDSLKVDSLYYWISNVSVAGIDKNFYDFRYTFVDSGSFEIVQELVGYSGCRVFDTALVNIYKGFESGEVIEWKNISVLNPLEIELSWWEDPEVVQYFAERVQQNGSVLLGQMFQTRFIDSGGISPITRPYSYQIRAIDRCGKEKRSPVGSSLFLEGSNRDNEFAFLNWTAGNIWEEYDTRYTLFRYGNTPMDSFVIYEGRDREWRDDEFADLSTFENCYLITCENMKTGEVAIGNRICIPLNMEFWVPSSFSPNGDGLNDSFSVFGLGLDKDGYILNIYSKWGELLFESTNPESSWSGNYKDRQLPEGVYFYTLRVQGIATGEVKTISGVITLLR